MAAADVKPAHRAAGVKVARRVHHPRNRRGEGSHLRADILTAATDLLDRGGPRAITLRAVARRAGITAPSIYPHFPGRAAVLTAVLREAFADLAGRIEAAMNAAGEDAEQRLYAACRAYLDFAVVHPERYRAMFGELGDGVGTDDGPAAGDPAHGGATALPLLAGVLADCVEAGRSTSDDPSADAIALWLGLHGLAHQRAVSHAFPRPGDLERSLVAPLSHIVPARPGASSPNL